MKVLVTGATGFIGFALTRCLLALHHEVVALGGENSEFERVRRLALQESGASVHIGSVCDQALVHELVRGCDTVFHLAAAQHETHVSDQHFYDVNVEGTRNLLQACVEAGTSRFVYASTIGVYGSARDGALDESSPTRPDNIYSKTKLQAEEVVRSYTGRVPWTIVRIAETYGPGDGRLVKLFRLVDKGLFPLIGDGANEHHPVYLDDLVDGLLLAANRQEAIGEVFVLAGPEVLSTRRMLEFVAGALGKSLRIVRIPKGPLYLAAVTLEKLLGPLDAPIPWTRRRLDFFSKRFFFSLDKAGRLLGYQPVTPFQEGAARTAEWYRDHGHL